MFYRLNRKLKLLEIDDNFAELLSVNANGDLVFEFCYSVKQTEVVPLNALTVIATVTSRTIDRRPLLENSHDGTINTRALIGNVLRQVQNAKSTLKQRESYTVASRRSNILTKINNENIPQLSAKVPKHLISKMRRTRLRPTQNIDLMQHNEVKPLMQMTAHENLLNTSQTLSSSIELPARRIMHDMIVRQRIDPSSIADMTHRSLAAASVFGGLLRPSRVPERSFDPAVQLLHHHLFRNNKQPFRKLTSDVDDQQSVFLPVSAVEDDVTVPITMLITKVAQRVDGKEIANFMVKFELLDSNSCAVIDAVTKPLDIARHLKLFHTPKKPPTVNVATSPLTSRVNLEIRQRDEGATGVKVFKKVISRASVSIDDYALIGTYSLSSRGILNVQADRSLESPALYRVVALGDFGAVGSEFTNVVVGPSHYRPIKAVAVNAQNVEQGIEVEVREIPPDCVAIEIVCRNRTTHEKVWTNVGGITLIDDSTRALNRFSVVHEDVNSNRAYEYVAKIIFRGGTTEIAGNTLIERIPSKPGKVDIKLSNLLVDHDDFEPNVTFNIASIILDKDIDIIRRLLDKQNIKEFFNEDLKREREFMQSLIAHNVQRVNLTTGDREDFGVVTNEFFSDRELRKSLAVEPLRYENRYRYEVTALVRAPETMFDSFEKTRVDEVTKKTYTFNPSKSLHPIALRDGTLVTKSGLKTRYAKDSMSHGQLGVTETLEVTFNRPRAKIVDQLVSRFNKGLNVITWKIDGSTDQIDHFIIMKDVHGVRTIIGKSHAEFEFNNGQYIHPVGDLDGGEMKYVIVPIFNDYTVGEEESTNMVIV